MVHVEEDQGEVNVDYPRYTLTNDHLSYTLYIDHHRYALTMGGLPRRGGQPKQF